MKISYPDYYKNFSCIAGECPDTCCAGWEIVVDGVSAEKYRNIKGIFGDKIRRVLTEDEDGDLIFESDCGKCPFLLENRLCEMYVRLGEEALCETCKKFPRFTSEFGSRREIGISLACPEAARIIMNCTDIPEILTEETDAPPELSDFDAEAYIFLLRLRETLISFLKAETASEAICDMLLICEKLNGFVKKRKFGEAAEILSGFSGEGRNFEPNPSAAKRTLKKMISDHLAAEALSPDWKNIISSIGGIRTEYPEENELKSLAFYLIFKYIILAAYDGNLSGKAGFCAVVFIMLRALCSQVPEKAERIRLVQRYSKEISDSACNMAMLAGQIEKSRYYSTTNLINILSSKEIDL